MATKDEFVACLALLSGGIGRPMPEEQATAWYLILGDLSKEVLHASIERYLRENETTFFPAPATILRLSQELTEGRLPTADEAFTEFLAAKRRFDPFYQAIELMASLSPLTRQAVQACGGTVAAAELQAEDRQIYAGQFRKAFEAISARADRQRRLPESLRPRLAANYSAPDGPSRLPVEKALRILRPIDDPREDVA